jgi:hypothetical protein
MATCDDAFLRDSRLRPLPMKDPSRPRSLLGVVPPDADGPIAVVAAVHTSRSRPSWPRSFGNLADTDGDLFSSRACSAAHATDARCRWSRLSSKARRVLMEVRNWVIRTAAVAPAVPH